MTKLERFEKRLKEELGIEIVDFRRTYLKLEALAAGGFSWTATCVMYQGKPVKMNIGSAESVTDLLKYKHLDMIPTYHGTQLDVGGHSH